MCVGPDEKGLSATQIATFIREEDVDQAITREKLRANPSASKTPMTLPDDHTLPKKTPHHPFLDIPTMQDEVEAENSLLSHKRGPLEKAFKMESRDIAK